MFSTIEHKYVKLNRCFYPYVCHEIVWSHYVHVLQTYNFTMISVLFIFHVMYTIIHMYGIKSRKNKECAYNRMLFQYLVSVDTVSLIFVVQLIVTSTIISIAQRPNKLL